MQFKSGYCWDAGYDEERNIYSAVIWAPGSILYEINKEIWDQLENGMDNTASLIIGKGRRLYMDINDKYGPPYTIVFDEDYHKIAPWVAVTSYGEKWSREMTDAVVEVLEIEKDNREQRGQKAKQRKEKTPKIGVSWLLDKELLEIDKRCIAYMESVRQAGGEPTYLSLIKSEEEAEEILDGIDGLLMTGGEDIDPALYGQENLYCGEINEERDLSDSLLLKAAIKRNIPVLCICRGMQMLNVVCGGTLYQDLEKQNKTDIIHRDPNGGGFVEHQINVDDNSHLARAINGDICHFKGWHHQAVKTIGDDLRVTATADDGIIEAIQLKGVDYIYGVQFHPELYTVMDGQDGTDLFKTFVNYCR